MKNLLILITTVITLAGCAVSQETISTSGTYYRTAFGGDSLFFLTENGEQYSISNPIEAANLLKATNLGENCTDFAGTATVVLDNIKEVTTPPPSKGTAKLADIKEVIESSAPTCGI